MANRNINLSTYVKNDRLRNARFSALARNPRLQAAAINNAGTYTLADSTTVVVTVSASAPTGTSYPTPGTRVLSDYEKLVYVEGGYRGVIYSSNVWAPAARTAQGGSWTGGGGVADDMQRFTTETNSPVVSFTVLPAGSGGDYRMRFLVEGQYIDLAGHAVAVTTSSPSYYTLTFSTTKTRTVTLETQMRYVLQRIVVNQGANSYSLNRPADQKPRVMFVADSYGLGPAVSAGAAGATDTMQGAGMYQHAADWLGVEPIIGAIGGTGFVSGGAGQSYPERFQDVLDINNQQALDAVHIHGSVNDAFNAATASAIQTAATNYLLNAVGLLPLTPITLSGCLQLSSTYATKSAQVEAAYKAAVDSVVATTGTKLLKFIPVQDPAYIQAWPASGGNIVIYTDNVHLTQAGHEACGKRMATDVFRAWQAMGI